MILLYSGWCVWKVIFSLSLFHGFSFSNAWDSFNIFCSVMRHRLIGIIFDVIQFHYILRIKSTMGKVDRKISRNHTFNTLICLFVVLYWIRHFSSVFLYSAVLPNHSESVAETYIYEIKWKIVLRSFFCCYWILNMANLIGFRNECFLCRFVWFWHTPTNTDNIR